MSSFVLTTLAGQTGKHIFSKTSIFRYNKTENLPREAFERFDFILFGSNSADLREIAQRNFSVTHKEHFTVEAFHKIQFQNVQEFPYWVPTLKFRSKVMALKKVNGPV